MAGVPYLKHSRNSPLASLRLRHPQRPGRLPPSLKVGKVLFCYFLRAHNVASRELLALLPAVCSHDILLDQISTLFPGYTADASEEEFSTLALRSLFMGSDLRASCCLPCPGTIMTLKGGTEPSSPSLLPYLSCPLTLLQVWILVLWRGGKTMLGNGELASHSSSATMWLWTCYSKTLDVSVLPL